MADINIDEAKAKIWIGDVESEIDNVEKLIKKINGAVSEAAGEDDTIMQGIYKVGTTMEETWTVMCDGLKEATVQINNALTKIFTQAQEVLEDIDTLKNKIR